VGLRAWTILERRIRGGCELGRDEERRVPQVYRARASRWCKCRTLTAIGVDGVRTVERERARRRWTRRARGVREVLEAAVLAGGGE
jgi:hypothetical protein